MIDPSTEDIFLLSQGRIRLRSRPSTATMWRWALRGVRGAILDSIVIGGRRYTSLEAFDRFTQALNCSVTATGPIGPRQRRREKDIAARRVAELFGAGGERGPEGDDRS